ncbi:Regulatory protein MarR [Crenothrix polyspora]|uniref:Regulatory protein MarR n=1 Tax=Crenothrix polyspora TaxID=360316 RepID=A0A1R4HF39_9GAMM|nr:MarR family winged helix-turn-helix transcriptional regulator [Crenothrix polyspora]SJM94833.1 Regulatory protein MarR [Crenothrix polyspora]
METIDVFDLIERMSALIRSEERKKCAALGLQAVHLQALNYILRCNRYSDTPAALTNYLGMTRGTVSQTLSLLEKKGYIKKTADTHDRRIVHLALLPEGQTILEKARPAELFIKAGTLLQKKANIGDYENIFANALTALQKANRSQSFGQCKTCHYFTTTDDGFLCGLTKQALSQTDSEKICQEHTVVLSRY